MDIKSMITCVNENLGFLPAYAEDAGAWEESFANRQKFLRFHIGNLIVRSGDGYYEGDVGDHGLSLCGVSVRVDDGYRALLQAWLDAAGAELQAGMQTSHSFDPQIVEAVAIAIFDQDEIFNLEFIAKCDAEGRTAPGDAMGRERDTWDNPRNRQCHRGYRRRAVAALTAVAAMTKPHETPSQRLADIVSELLAFVKDIARMDPVFVKGHEKQRIADARALVAKAGAA